MPYIQCPGKYWAIIVDGEVTETGKDQYQLNDRPDITIFDSEVDFHNNSLVTNYLNRLSKFKEIKKLLRYSVDQEYAGKAENAIRWKERNITLAIGDVGDYTAEKYPWMALEINERGITPRQCCEEIWAAMNREDESLKNAEKRIKLREQIKNS